MKSSVGISEIRGWSDLEGEAGRKECEMFLERHPILKAEGWKADQIGETWVVIKGGVGRNATQGQGGGRGDGGNSQGGV